MAVESHHHGQKSNLLYTVASGAAQLTVATTIVRALSILSFPILTRLLSPASYGVASLASTAISLTTIIAVAGQDSSYIKAFFDHKNYSSTAVDRFYYAYSRLAALFAGIVVSVVWIFLGSSTSSDSQYLAALFIGLGSAGSVLAVFRQARARLMGTYGKLFWATIAAGATSTAACIVAAWGWRRDELALLLAGMSPWVLMLLLPAPQGPPSLRPEGMDSSSLARMIKIGLPLVATAPGYWVVASADRWFLASWTTKEVVGVYSLAATVAALGQMLTGALTNVWYPELARQLHRTDLTNLDDLRDTHTLLIWLLGITCFGLTIFGSEAIVLLASSEFHSAARYLPWLSLGLLFYGVNQFQGFGFTMAGQNHAVPLIWGAVAAFALGANAIVVPTWHADGAAVAQCLSFLLAAFLTWAVSYSITPFQPHWRLLFLSFVLLAVLVAVNISVIEDLGTAIRLLAKSLCFVFGALVTLHWVLKPSNEKESLLDRLRTLGHQYP